MLKTLKRTEWQMKHGIIAHNVKNGIVVNVVQINGKIIVDGVELPPCPSKSANVSSTIINGNVYLNGYEYKNGEWKRTLKALWHLMF